MNSSKLLPKSAFALVAGLVSTGTQAVQFNSLTSDSQNQTSDEALTWGNLSSSAFANGSGGDLSGGSADFEDTFTVSFDIFINETCEGRTFTVRQRPTLDGGTTTPMPELGTLALVGLALAGMGAAKRKALASA